MEKKYSMVAISKDLLKPFKVLCAKEEVSMKDRFDELVASYLNQKNKVIYGRK